MTNQPTPGPFFNSPKKRNTSSPLFFGVWVCFFGGKKPPNLRNINFQQKKHLSLGWTSVSAAWWSTWTFACLYRQTPRASRWEPNVPQVTSLEKSCCVLLYLFFSENTRTCLWGGGGGSKKLRTISFVFSKFGWKNQLELSKKHELSMDWSFHRFWRLRYLMKSSFMPFFPTFENAKKTTGSQETSEAAASELATWPWSSSSSSQAGKNSTPHGVKWGQIESNQIVWITQVLSSKFWLCNLFQTHTCSVFSVFVAQTCSCCDWRSTGLSSVSLLLWRIGSSILYRKLIGSFRLGIQ